MKFKKLKYKLLCFGIVGCVLTLSYTSAYASDAYVSREPFIHIHSSESGSCYTPIYHTHTGDVTNGGDCYEPVYHTQHSTNCYTYRRCSKCRNNNHCADVCWFDDKLGWHCNCPNKKKVLTCTKTLGESIDSYVFSCDLSTEEPIGYELTCTDTEINGYLSLSKKVVDNDYSLEVGVELVDDTPNYTFSWLWSDGSTSNSIKVNGNGTYWCDVTVVEEESPQVVRLTYEVTDYDLVAPVVEGVTYSVERISTAVTVDVSATDNIEVTKYVLERR